jgi:hypothetical protein
MPDDEATQVWTPEDDAVPDVQAGEPRPDDPRHDYINGPLGLAIEYDPNLPDPLTHTCRGDKGCGMSLQNVEVERHMEFHGLISLSMIPVPAREHGTGGRYQERAPE